MTPSVVHVPDRGEALEIEYGWLNRQKQGAGASAPLVVFLHEGLGSVSAWRDFPAELCARGGFRGLAYSRPGHGRSTVRPSAKRRSVDYIHQQALELLPVLLESVGINTWTEPPWLFGHSEGGSIALIHAAASPRRVGGLILLAPHIFVEDASIASIKAIRSAYQTTDLPTRLARHHADPDGAFWGWNDLRLDPDFRRWTIESLLPSIRCPLLAIQGRDDEYATLAQLEGIRSAVPQAQLLVLEGCGHSPHRDHPERLIDATVDFVTRHHRARPGPQ